MQFVSGKNYENSNRLRQFFCETSSMCLDSYDYGATQYLVIETI
jgi:hypothetical protein